MRNEIVICLIFLADLFKRSPRGILNSVIAFLIASAFQRIYPYQRAAFRETEDLFSAMGNGNGGLADQFQWLLLTFDPTRPVAGCPSTIHRGLSGSTLRHVRYIIDEPRSLLHINVKDVYTSNILTFSLREYFRLPRCYLRITNPHTLTLLHRMSRNSRIKIERKFLKNSVNNKKVICTFLFKAIVIKVQKEPIIFKQSSVQE